MELTAGTELAHGLRLELCLGAGGMGSVWLGRHHGAEVAVKVMAASLVASEELRARFAREVRACQSIASPHVVQVLAHGLAPDGAPYLVMELCRGESLRQKLERAGRLPAEEVAAIVAQIGRALGAAHAAGVVHRDIKPDNVFLLAAPEGFVKVLDFGVARRDAADERTLTADGTLLGTPSYMSPEQLLFPRQAEPAFDVWALGVLAYEALVGRRPYEGEGLVEIVRAVCETEAPPPSRAGLHAAFDAFFAQALARDPARRFASPEALARAFDTACRLALGDSATVAVAVRREPTRATAWSAAPTLVSPVHTAERSAAPVPAAERSAAPVPAAGTVAPARGSRRGLALGAVAVALVAGGAAVAVALAAGSPKEPGPARADAPSASAPRLASEGTSGPPGATPATPATATADPVPSEPTHAPRLAPTAPDPRCAGQPCDVLGRCSFGPDECMVLGDADCARLCVAIGHCHAERGYCRARYAIECRESDSCREWGRCTMLEGACVAGPAEACQASVHCRERGECSLAGAGFRSVCAPASDADCLGSTLCEVDRQCWHRDGACVRR
ncbi:MAG: protein kinase [Polyangiaceae bacterium]|nr:protein kinase [Polyangiaceae bacterium]